MTQHLTLTSFSVDPVGTPFLHITCRPCGLFSWLLAKLKLVNNSTLSISRECLDFQSTSYKSFGSLTVPMEDVTSVSYGAKKPYAYTVASVFCIVLALGLASVAPIAVPFLLLLAAYTGLCCYTRQYFYILLERGNDDMFCICLHPSLIERVSVELNEVAAACALIRKAMLLSKRG